MYNFLGGRIITLPILSEVKIVSLCTRKGLHADSRQRSRQNMKKIEETHKTVKTTAITKDLGNIDDMPLRINQYSLIYISFFIYYSLQTIFKYTFIER